MLNGHFDEVCVLNGEMDLGGGWYSRYYGSKIPAAAVKGRVKAQLPAGLLVAVKPSAGVLDVPHDLPWTLLPHDISNFLRSSKFSAFVGSQS